MSKFSPTALMPRYLQNFRCVGPECPETCCAGWRVTIDKHNFKLLKSIAEEPLRSRIRLHLQRSDQQDAASWGELRMTADGSCGFLDQDHLCMIQKQLGTAALSNTCNHYPRTYQKVENSHRVFATLSCPQAARLALMDPQALELAPIRLESFANEASLPPATSWGVRGNVASVSHLGGRVLHDLLIHLIASPHHSAFEALSIALMLIRRVCAFQTGRMQTPAAAASAPDSADTQAVEELTALFERFQDESHNSGLLSLLDRLETGQRFAPDMLREVSLTIRSRKLTRTARTVLQEVSLGFQLDEPDVQVSRDLCSSALTELWQPWEQSHRHVLKNYLINSIESSLPGRHFSDPVMLENAFLGLVIRAALIRYWLVAQMQLLGNNFTDDHVIGTISSLSRSIEHDARFMPSVLAALEEQGVRSLATAAVLLR